MTTDGVTHAALLSTLHPANVATATGSENKNFSCATLANLSGSRARGFAVWSIAAPYSWRPTRRSPEVFLKGISPLTLLPPSAPFRQKAEGVVSSKQRQRAWPLCLCVHTCCSHLPLLCVWIYEAVKTRARGTPRLREHRRARGGSSPPHRPSRHVQPVKTAGLLPPPHPPLLLGAGR